MSRFPRWVVMPVVALVLVCAVVAVQLANGGGTYEPLRPADACVERPVTSRADGIDGLAERLVLIGIDDAACRLGVSREELTLQVARSDDPTDVQIDALHDGLLSAVREMKADGSLPKASELVDEALDSTNLNPVLEAAIRAIPDAAVDKVLKTDDVLTRAIDDLDLRELLTNLDDQGDLEKQVQDAVMGAVRDSLEARIRDLV